MFIQHIGLLKLLLIYCLPLGYFQNGGRLLQYFENTLAISTKLFEQFRSLKYFDLLSKLD